MPTDISKGLTFFQGEPLIKNSHLITHVSVYDNQQVILFSDKALYVYSYQHMLKDQAALVNIVDYQSMFKSCLTQEKGKKIKPQIYHMDQITTIFNDPHHHNNSQKTFGDRIFANPKDINTNILLQGQHFINRLTYLNSIKVKNVDLSIHGDLLINFVNGQSLLVRRDNTVNYYKSYHVVDLTLLTKRKVQLTKFIQGSNNLLVMYSDQKVIVFDYLRNTQISTHKYTHLEFLNQIHSFKIKSQQQSSQQQQQIFIAFQHPQKIVLYEYNQHKKKLTYSQTLDLKQSFIQKIFTYPKSNSMYISIAKQMLKLDLNQLINTQQREIQKLSAKMIKSKSKESQKSNKSPIQKIQNLKYQTFQHSNLQQILYLNNQGDFIPKCKNTTKQYLNLVTETDSGIFIGVTCKKQGNYKQGQLLIGIRDDCFHQMIRKCCLKITSINQYEHLNFQDLTVFSTNTKLKKQIVPQLSKLFNQSFNKFQDHPNSNIQKIQNNLKIQIQGVQLNQQEFQVLFLNLGYLFESKQAMRQKIIQKKLLTQFKKLNKQQLTQSQIINVKDLKQKCIFTFKQIGDQKRILECKKCDLYGIKQKMEDSQIWEDGMRNGFHRCPVCLNCMKLID